MLIADFKMENIYFRISSRRDEAILNLPRGHSQVLRLFQFKLHLALRLVLNSFIVFVASNQSWRLCVRL